MLGAPSPPEEPLLPVRLSPVGAYSPPTRGALPCLASPELALLLSPLFPRSSTFPAAAAPPPRQVPAPPLPAPPRPPEAPRWTRSPPPPPRLRKTAAGQPREPRLRRGHPLSIRTLSGSCSPGHPRLDCTLELGAPNSSQGHCWSRLGVSCPHCTPRGQVCPGQSGHGLPGPHARLWAVPVQSARPAVAASSALLRGHPFAWGG